MKPTATPSNPPRTRQAARTLTALAVLAPALVATASAQGGTRTVFSVVQGTIDPHVVDLGTTIWFAAGAGQAAMYRSDGTAAGTQLVPGSQVNAGWPAAAGGTVFFRGFTAAAGYELWKTDGTAAGTVMVQDLYPGQPGGAPHDLLPYGNLLLFNAAVPGFPSDRLCVSDGTTAGTVPIGPRMVAGVPELTSVVRGTMYYTGAGDHGAELWRTDGTAAGTYEVADIWPGPLGSGPGYLMPFRGELYFVADDGVNGMEIWKTDGTPTGTIRAVPGSLVAGPRNLRACGAWIYFGGSDPSAGIELWRTDGTPAGTVRVKDIEPGFGHSDPRVLTDLDGILLFFASRSADGGYELWRSDGTVAGTSLVMDINPAGASLYGINPAHSLPRVGSRFVYFQARVGSDIFLWRSDGTTAGTTSLGGPPGFATPSDVTHAAGDTLFLAALAGPNRALLMAYDAGATAKSHGVGCGGGQKPTMRATDPVLGASSVVSGGDALAGSVAMVLMGRWSDRPLPLGAGCSLYLRPGLLVPLSSAVVSAAGQWSATVPIPNDGALVGGKVGLQAVIAPGSSPLGLDLSAGVLLDLGR